MYDLKKEYDQFGPWLVEIKSEQDIPPQFFEQQHFFEDALYSFKIPVHQERRNMKPGMLLYPEVVIIQKDFILHLKIDGERIHADKMWYTDVLFLTHGGDLLDNFIGLQSIQGEMVIKYNLVSQDVASSVIKLLREIVSPRNAYPIATETSDQSLMDKVTYSFYCGTEQILEPLHILAYQSEKLLTDRKRSSLMDLYHNFTQHKLLRSMIMTDGVDLIIANQGKHIIDVKDTNYKFGHTFIRLDLIESVSITPHAHFPELNNLILKVGLCDFTLAVDNQFSINKVTELLHSTSLIEEPA
ncbi:hypothetical protein BCU70_19585 [Vibrio sp. 10N.286.49.C2]|uniref:hypothetical protein n=1 Tax=unclassified Vibrio TaxID=2614977 RepID=UPI000C843EC7|nr:MULTISPECIES: hypothetical protein [unclassified Vibrio]PMH34864.1 hypothetical protein BCU70_19585 [Vibrio sp. 10N.286.49.C2]PMH51348.1 hypothetical protein BCU66_16530 [Vibrio sp. 10N.286.49.B1]PMH83705.1 hypothetical protein BCU58_13810 [Vibrio sp. 10N.286.48.B7]